MNRKVRKRATRVLVVQISLHDLSIGADAKHLSKLESPKVGAAPKTRSRVGHGTVGSEADDENRALGRAIVHQRLQTSNQIELGVKRGESSAMKTRAVRVATHRDQTPLEKSTRNHDSATVEMLAKVVNAIHFVIIAVFLKQIVVPPFAERQVESALNLNRIIHFESPNLNWIILPSLDQSLRFASH